MRGVKLQSTDNIHLRIINAIASTCIVIESHS